MKNVLQLVTNTPKGVTQYSFYCPGCECDHAVWTKNLPGKNTWSWNGDLVSPTVSPSIKVTGYSWKNKKDFICHFYIKNGTIQYLQDCTHKFAGQTIEMEPIK